MKKDLLIKILSCILSAFIITSNTSISWVSASNVINDEDSQYYENWGWNYDNGTLRIFGENATPDINPLEDLAGKEEENLPYYYKYFSEITSLVIENDIKEIGDYGFCDLDYLESITLPNSLVTIGEQSFSSTGVTEITIPKYVQTIEKGAFIGCWQLKLAYVMCRDVDIQEYALGYKNDFSNDKYEDFIIYGYADSTAETYANENGFTFIALDEQPTTTTTTESIVTTTTASTTTVFTNETKNESTTDTTTNTNTVTTDAITTVVTTETETDTEQTTATTTITTETDTEPTTTLTTTDTPGNITTESSTVTAVTTTRTDTTLPQTGYSKWYQVIAGLAVCMTGIGGAMVIGFGKLKKKRK